MLTKGKYNFRAIILGGIVSRYSFEEFLFFEFQDNFVCTALEFFNLEIVQKQFGSCPGLRDLAIFQKIKGELGRLKIK